MTDAPLVEVIQADRDAAAELARICNPEEADVLVPFYQGGGNSPLAEAFARHRIQSEVARLSTRGDGAEDGRLGLTADRAATPTGPSPSVSGIAGIPDAGLAEQFERIGDDYADGRRRFGPVVDNNLAAASSFHFAAELADGGQIHEAVHALIRALPAQGIPCLHEAGTAEPRSGGSPVPEGDAPRLRKFKAAPVTIDDDDAPSLSDPSDRLSIGRNEVLEALLRDAREAIASLPEDTLGYGYPLSHEYEPWPIRDELLNKIDKALKAKSDV